MDVMVVGEDVLTVEVMVRLLAVVSPEVSIHNTHVCHGIGDVRRKMDRFRNASRAVPHVILVDLDNLPCPVEMIESWGLRRMPKSVLFRIAVREVEAWLLADSESLARYLGVPVVKIPTNPERLVDPKQTLINVARKSRSSRLAEEMVPSKKSLATIGPLYNERLSEFVKKHWRPAVARTASASLDRAIAKLAEFTAE